MSERGLLRLRGVLGWLATACCLCAGLALADGFIDSFRTGPNTFSLLPGGSESLASPLPVNAADASSMLVAIDHPGLTLKVITQSQGFWMGNRVWQGQVQAAADAKPGTATVTLRAPGDDGSGPAQLFTLQIFPDQDALNAASNSRIRRATGRSPLTAAAASGIAALCLGLLVYLTSRQLAILWTRQGKAVVYMTKKTPDGLLISFELGADHGLATGASVTVSDDSGMTVAMASVMRCSAADAAALVIGEGKVELGNIVKATPVAKTEAPRL